MKLKKVIVLRLLSVLIVLSVSFALASCVALLRAERLVYSGSIVKKPVAIEVDSVDNIKTEVKE